MAGKVDLGNSDTLVLLQELRDEMRLLRKQLTCQHSEKMEAHHYRNEKGEILNANWQGLGVCEKCGAAYRAPSPYLSLKH